MERSRLVRKLAIKRDNQTAAVEDNSRSIGKRPGCDSRVVRRITGGDNDIPVDHRIGIECVAVEGTVFAEHDIAIEHGMFIDAHEAVRNEDRSVYINSPRPIALHPGVGDADAVVGELDIDVFRDRHVLVGLALEPDVLKLQRAVSDDTLATKIWMLVARSHFCNSSAQGHCLARSVLPPMDIHQCILAKYNRVISLRGRTVVPAGVLINPIAIRSSNERMYLARRGDIINICHCRNDRALRTVVGERVAEDGASQENAFFEPVALILEDRGDGRLEDDKRIVDGNEASINSSSHIDGNCTVGADADTAREFMSGGNGKYTLAHIGKSIIRIAGGERQPSAAELDKSAVHFAILHAAQKGLVENHIILLRIKDRASSLHFHRQIVLQGKVVVVSLKCLERAAIQIDNTRTCRAGKPSCGNRSAGTEIDRTRSTALFAELNCPRGKNGRTGNIERSNGGPVSPHN